MKTVLGYIDAGRSEGAVVLAGGGRTREETGGYYVEPTVFTDVRHDMRIAREEIFGPVLAAITVKDAEEAVRVGNAVDYGRPPQSGPATSARRTGSRGPCGQAWST